MEIPYTTGMTLPDIRVKSNCEAIIGVKRKGHLKMGIIVVDQDGNIIDDIVPVVSNEFMVYSKRSKTKGNC